MDTKVAIISDSTCDLTQDIINNRNIKIIPLYVNFNEESLRDGIDITLDQLFETVQKNGVMPKTSAVPPAVFYDIFKQLVNDGYEVFYTGISSNLSTTYQNALTAIEEIDGPVYAVDSQNLSTGIGLLILKACDLRDMGYNAKAISEEIEKIVPRVKTQFVINTLEYLHKGGRCSGLTRFFGTILSIKPKIVVRNGSMSVGAKTIGSFKKAVHEMTKGFIADAKDIDNQYVFITHSMARDHYLMMVDQIKDIDVKNLYESSAGCIIGSHCGPGCIGILYILNDKTVEKEEEAL